MFDNFLLVEDISLIHSGLVGLPYVYSEVSFFSCVNIGSMNFQQYNMTSMQNAF